MPSINIRALFAERVLRAEIKLAICRGDGFRCGDKLYLYSGMLTRRCNYLRKTQCASVHSVHINGSTRSVILDNQVLADDEKAALAKESGFGDFDSFMRFYKDEAGLPLDGQVVRWL